MLQNGKNEAKSENTVADRDLCNEGNEDSENSKTETQQEGEDERRGVKGKVEFENGREKNVRMEAVA